MLNPFPHAEGSGKTIVPMQFFGLGDVIFCMEIANRWLAHGYKVVWPVLEGYVEGLNRAYPKVTFTDYKKHGFNWNKKQIHDALGCTLMPLRWSYEILKVPFTDCMRSKYSLFGWDWKDWRKGAMWQRDPKKELELLNLVNPSGKPFIAYNRYFRSDNSGVVFIPVNPKFVPVEVRTIPGFSLFDWAGVLEMAQEVHTVSTSILYIIEMLGIPAHFYIRRPDETSHKNYDYILTQKHYLHT
jgi:hypothetical protein